MRLYNSQSVVSINYYKALSLMLEQKYAENQLVLHCSIIGIQSQRLDQNLPVVTDPIQNDSFRLSAAIKFVPPFDDVDMTQFLNAFEKAMAIHNFPKDKWTQLIHTKLT